MLKSLQKGPIPPSSFSLIDVDEDALFIHTYGKEVTLFINTCLMLGCATARLSSGVCLSWSLGRKLWIASNRQPSYRPLSMHVASLSSRLTPFLEDLPLNALSILGRMCNMHA